MREFRIDVQPEQVEDLRHRIRATRWPGELPGVGWDRGAPEGWLRDLAEYWAGGYDWAAAQAELNRYPQFRTEIDGATVHLLHVRSPEPDAVPLLLTHGWPSSVAEFLDVIGPLTDPRAHGGDPADAFHVIAPSIPGFGFSSPLRDTGWNARRVAGAWAELMRGLGYERYVVQGGDAGSVVSLELARLAPESVIGAHLTMLLAFPSGDPAELEDLSPADGAALQRAMDFDQRLSGYMKLQSTRPQTLAYALTDSPVGLLAWVAERFQEWSDEGFGTELATARDRILTTVSIYWFTATAGSSAQHYFEGAADLAGSSAPPPRPPVGVAVFPGDILPPVRRLADRDVPGITHWTEMPRGGHFPALEQPQLFTADVREFARPLRAAAGRFEELIA